MTLTRSSWLAVGLCGALARVASAGPDPAPPAHPADPPASEPAVTVFAPEKVAAKPAPAAGGEPMNIDQLVIAATSRIDLNFFGDLSVLDHTGGEPGLTIGPLGFQVTAHLAEGLVGRSEFVMAFENDETVVDVERAYLEYRTGGWLLAAGRTHAELGYWNNAFHHGRWLQPTINRPRAVRFEDEGGILPINHVGVTVVHAPPRGEAGLEVALAVGNGHGPAVTDIQTVGDKNLGKSLILRVGGAGLGDASLRFGVNAAIDDIAPEPMGVRPLLPDQRLLELIGGAYLALRADTWQVFAEVYDVIHRGGGQRWSVVDGFAVVGYHVEPFTPYAQVEARTGDGLRDPFYNPDPAAEPEAHPPENFVEGLLGLKYDLSAWSALKLEVSGRRFDTLDAATGTTGRSDELRVELNWSFGR